MTKGAGKARGGPRVVDRSIGGYPRRIAASSAGATSAWVGDAAPPLLLLLLSLGSCHGQGDGASIRGIRMAGKEITMVLKVDLDCERCNKKITRVLEKIKDKMNIKTTKFDKERNVVTISGPFDADKVRRKLCCEAGRIIKSMDVVVKAPEEKKDDGGVEKEEGRKAAAAAVDLGPLLKKMLEHPKPIRTPCTCCCCGCSCGNKQTTQPPAQGVPVAAKSVWPAPASSVVISGHGYDEAPPSYYGVPVYSSEGWY